MRRSWPLLTVLLVGCGAQQPLPPPGAQGPILVRQWDAEGGRQIVLKARAVRPAPDTALKDALDRMDLETVLVRAPFAEGVLYAATPSARVSATGDQHPVALPVPDRDAGANVALAGVVRGQPACGRAARAWLRREDQALVLEEVELVEMGRGGSYTVSDRVIVHQDEQIETVGRTRSDRGDAAVLGALAALPTPLELPELTTK